ncbi:MAG: hypothetical protein EAZ95_08910 [Bacteroidetes bacterium]|nr:MAG: hypothetical protein EAZ95_08910 [Bacteroidota bacterium]
MQITLQVRDNSKIAFLFELLKRLEFVEITSSTPDTDDFDADSFLNHIKQEREQSAHELHEKIDTLFQDI